MILLKLVASRTLKSSDPLAAHHATCPLSPTLFFSHPWPVFPHHLFFRFSLLRKIQVYKLCVCLCQSVSRRMTGFSRSWYIPSLSENEAYFFVSGFKGRFSLLVNHPYRTITALILWSSISRDGRGRAAKIFLFTLKPLLYG
jgi:hypothetical protein